MGRESEQQQIEMSGLEVMAAMLRESLTNLERVIEFGKRNNVTSLTIRQVPKGKRALEGLLDFTSLLNVALVNQVLPIPNKQYPRSKPLSLAVAEKLQHAEEVVDEIKTPKKPKPGS